MSTIQIGTAVAAPGEIGFGELPIAVGMDAREVSIPIAIINGAKPGPTLLIEGGLHGIEIVTVEICRQLAKERVNPQELSGTVILAPQLNPWAFLASTRFTPQDFQDMNRVFPGSPSGSLSYRVADVVTRELLDQADYVIDCHSCNPPSLHFTIVGEEGSRAVRAKSLGMAKALGYPIVNAATNYAGTLSGYCLNAGKPTITPEYVFSRRFDPTSVSTGVTGMLNVIKHLQMLPGEQESFQVEGYFPEVLTYRSIGASKGGFCHLTQPLGARVKKGDAVAILMDVWGNVTEQIEAFADGIVIAYPLQLNSACSSGDKICYLAYEA